MEWGFQNHAWSLGVLTFWTGNGSLNRNDDPQSQYRFGFILNCGRNRRRRVEDVAAPQPPSFLDRELKQTLPSPPFGFAGERFGAREKLHD